MGAVATFFVNLLCSFVSCDAPFPPPDIRGAIIPYQQASSPFSRTILPLIQEPPPTVQTSYGVLQGYSMRTAGNRKIYAFEGIPYAEPPTERWRFKTAGPLRPWKGVRLAKRPGSPCLQLSLPKALRVIGNEDCLYLNIYSPILPGQRDITFGAKLLPVIINIHGGSYYFGMGHELGPSYLLDKEVVFVTFNYRLGVMGFLSTGDHNSPGNYGLKDQALLIEWIHENIVNFGGDPRRITLLGQSSGAACAHLHLLSNRTSPYIASGVSLSGSAFTYWALKSKADSARLTRTLAKRIGCLLDSNAAIVKCLRQRNPVEVVAAQYSLLEFAPFPTTLFSPVVEDFGSDDAFLTQKPEVLYWSKAVPRKPWIFGLTSQEGYLGLLLLQSFVNEGALRTKWQELSTIYLDYKYSTPGNLSDVTDKVTKFYFGYKPPKSVKESKIAAVFGDRLMLPGIAKALEYHSPVAPTYAYIFGFKGRYSLGRIVGRTPSEWGVGHGEDLYYYFNSSSYLPGFRHGDVEELSMSNLMTGFLANFAATGQPALPQGNNVYSTLWEPVHPQNVKFLQLNRDLKMIQQPFKKRLNFWNKLGQNVPTLLDPLINDI